MPTVPAGSLTFDYNTVPAKDRKWLKGITQDIKAATARVRGDLIAIGKWITSVKERIPYGAYEAWCACALPFGKRTVYNLAQVAKVFGDGGDDGSANLPNRTRAAVERIEPSALYVLATPSCPPEARTAALAIAEKGETVTHEKARELIDEARKDDAPRNRGEPVYWCLQDLIDRIEAAIEDGRIVCPDVPDPGPDTPLPIPLWMLARIYRIAAPQEFPADAPEPAPVDAPPGSDAKIAAMRDRVCRGEALFTRRDPDPIRDGRAVVIEKRAGGAGRVVDGVRQAPPPKPRGWA